MNKKKLSRSSSLLEPYENPDDPNTTVGFNKDVTLENGIYFNAVSYTHLMCCRRQHWLLW